MLTRSWRTTTLIGIISLWLAYIAQQFFYSRSLRLLIPQFLGRWLIAVPLGLAVAAYCYSQGRIVAGVVTIFFVVLNLSGFSDFLLLFATPISANIKRILHYDFDDTALALVKILNRQARKAGVALDWTRY